MIRTYTELAQLESFEDRFDYLSIKGVVGEKTFGFERHLNQRFYSSREWRLIRDEVLTRDLGCDMGVEGYDISQRPIIHHMNPMIPKDLIHGNEDVLDPEFLITVTHRTHNAIHYGDKSLLALPIVERRPGDTRLWSKPLMKLAS
jgi:hypothetical protein